MVPVIWAFFSAEVNAGTASAARIAIIAITTSSSISVNAEEGLFILSFMLGFSFCCVPPSHKATADKCSEGFLRGLVLFWGFLFWFGLRFVQRGYSEVRALSQSSRVKSIIIFWLFRVGRNLTQSAPAFAQGYGVASEGREEELFGPQMPSVPIDTD